MKWPFSRKKTVVIRDEKEISRVTNPDVIAFFRSELREGEATFSQLRCEYCGHGLIFQDIGDYFDLWCMNRECLESEMHRVYKEDL